MWDSVDKKIPLVTRWDGVTKGIQDADTVRRGMWLWVRVLHYRANTYSVRKGRRVGYPSSPSPKISTMASRRSASAAASIAI